MVSFVTASKPFADWISLSWKEIVDADPSEYKHKNSKAFYVNVNGKNACNLCRALLQTRVNQLNRKWGVAIQEIARWEQRDKHAKEDTEMKKYIPVIHQAVIGITCDRCQYFYSAATSEFDVCITILHSCGFGSVWQDGQTI